MSATGGSVVEIESCVACSCRFEVIEVGGGMTSKELEDMKCPYCGHIRRRLARGRLKTRPLPEQAEDGSSSKTDDASF
jgi:DNA-directed RNA polymerase subunit RPC12/RpoP